MLNVGETICTKMVWVSVLVTCLKLHKEYPLYIYIYIYNIQIQNGVLDGAHLGKCLSYGNTGHLRILENLCTHWPFNTSII